MRRTTVKLVLVIKRHLQQGWAACLFLMMVCGFCRVGVAAEQTHIASVWAPANSGQARPRRTEPIPAIDDSQSGRANLDDLAEPVADKVTTWNPTPPLPRYAGEESPRNPSAETARPQLFPAPSRLSVPASEGYLVPPVLGGEDPGRYVATGSDPTHVSGDPSVPHLDAPFEVQDCPVPVWADPHAPFVPYDPRIPEEEETLFSHISEGFLSALTAPIEPMAAGFATLLGAEHDEPHTELDEYPIGIQPIPDRPPLIVELNEGFEAPGFLKQGIVLPTGAIWRPALWVFGTFRTGVNYFDNGTGSKVVEWANSLSLFSQLNLSGTERILFGINPLDEEELSRREFTSYDFERGQWLDGWNGDVQTLFFEGDFGEIFPYLDPYDTRALDYGFSVGRQPMLFQQGLLLNEDRIDALTITRNTLYGDGNLNLRATFVYAWGGINRHNLAGGNTRDDDAQMVGLFTESDFRVRTINADAAYVWSNDGSDDLFVFGVSSIRRFHGFHNTYNSSFHVLASFPTHGETTRAGQGELLFHQLSWTPHHSDDLIFLNSFWAIDQFTSASRGPLAGGPLGQTGLLFSAAGLGRYGAPLSNQSSSVVGASLGYQMFFDHHRQQVVYEVGGRQDTNSVNQAAIGTGIRYQKALGQHWLVIVDGFVAKREDREVSQGARLELQMKF